VLLALEFEFLVDLKLVKSAQPGVAVLLAASELLLKAET
jgi:hypothetical protein